jgi:hypothetical protein
VMCLMALAQRLNDAGTRRFSRIDTCGQLLSQGCKHPPSLAKPTRLPHFCQFTSRRTTPDCYPQHLSPNTTSIALRPTLFPTRTFTSSQLKTSRWLDVLLVSSIDLPLFGLCLSRMSLSLHTPSPGLLSQKFSESDANYVQDTNSQ